MARSGQRWARHALDALSPLLYVSASGFEEGFEQRVREEGREVTCWSLGDLYENAETGSEPVDYRAWLSNVRRPARRAAYSNEGASRPALRSRSGSKSPGSS
jgi:hypothetical protein